MGSLSVLKPFLAGTAAAAPAPASAAAAAILSALDGQTAALAELASVLEQLDRKVDQLISAPLLEGLHHLRDFQGSSSVAGQSRAAEKARDSFVLAASQGPPMQRALAALGCAFCWAAEREEALVRRWLGEGEASFALASQAAAAEIQEVMSAPVPIAQRRNADRYRRARADRLISPIQVVLRSVGEVLDEGDGGGTVVHASSFWVNVGRTVPLGAPLVLPSTTVANGPLTLVKPDDTAKTDLFSMSIEVLERRQDAAILALLGAGPLERRGQLYNALPHDPSADVGTVIEHNTVGSSANLRAVLFRSAMNYVLVTDRRRSDPFTYCVGAQLPPSPELTKMFRSK